MRVSAPSKQTLLATKSKTKLHATSERAVSAEIGQEGPLLWQLSLGRSLSKQSPPDQVGPASSRRKRHPAPLSVVFKFPGPGLDNEVRWGRSRYELEFMWHAHSLEAGLSTLRTLARPGYRAQFSRQPRCARSFPRDQRRRSCRKENRMRRPCLDVFGPASLCPVTDRRGCRDRAP